MSEDTRVRRLVGASLILMSATIASRGLGLVREIVISHQFGTSRELDAYNAAFRIPDLIFQIVAAGAMGAAFIPVFSSYLARRDEDGAWRMASTVLNAVFLVVLIAAGLAALGADQLVEIVVPGFAEADRKLVAGLMRIMLLSPIFTSLSGLTTAILNSYQSFVLPALAPILYNLSIIVAAIALTPALGIHGLAVGVATGAAMHLGIQIPGLVQRHMAWRPLLDLSDAGARTVGRLMIPRMVGLGAIQINYLANAVIASFLPVGSLAALNYAFQLIMLPWGIFASAIATAVFPTLAEQTAQQRPDEARRTLAAALRTVLFLVIPASVGLFILRTPLVGLLFQRGNFTAESTAMTTYALALYAPGLVGLAATEIITRGFYALQDTKTPVAVGVVTVAVNIALSLILSGPLQHGGLALAYTLANSGEAIVLFWLIHQRLGHLEDAQLLLSLGRAGLATLIMGEALVLFLLIAGSPASSGTLLQRLIGVGSALALGSGVYLGMAMVVGSEEVARLTTLRLGRSRPQKNP
jgi:putative peptidoglycan lipid II flippase